MIFLQIMCQGPTLLTWGLPTVLTSIAIGSNLLDTMRCRSRYVFIYLF